MSAKGTVRWGIDLGTTNSALAILTDDRVRVVTNDLNDDLTPSAVYFTRTEDGEVDAVVGRGAKNMILGKPGRVATEFKQNMGIPHWRFRPDGLGLEEDAPTLSGRVLEYLRQSVSLHGDLPPLRTAVVTVPAAFKNPSIQDTYQAARAAGIEYVEVLPEPVAAALAYGHHAAPGRSAIWVAYDLGGGTFDVALVKWVDGVFTILDHGGDRNLGGKNLDNAIVMELLVPKLPAELQAGVEPWKSASWWVLKDAVERAKCALSAKEKVRMSEVTIGGQEFAWTLHANDIERLQVKLFKRTLDMTMDLLRRNDFAAKDIEKIILVGGPTLSPFLRKMIAKGNNDASRGETFPELGIPIDCSVNPMTAVAEGAAIHAASRRVPSDVKLTLPNESPAGAVIAIEVNLPALSSEAEVLATGEVKALGSGVRVGAGWTVQFQRAGSKGVVTWSGKTARISEAGKFATRVPLVSGRNEFRIIVRDEGQNPVVAQGDTIAITHSKVSPGALTLGRGIGVANRHGKMVWFFEKGTSLPAKKSRPFRTTVALERGAKGAVLMVPLLEGMFDQSNLNSEINTVTATAEDIGAPIPRGSALNIEISINESRLITMAADFEDYDDAGIDVAFPYVEPNVDELNHDLNEVRETLQQIRPAADTNPELAELMRAIDGRLLTDVEVLIGQGSPEVPAPWDSAKDRVLELRAMLAQHADGARAVVAFRKAKERCDPNVALFSRMVDENRSDIPDEWFVDFALLRSQYEEACRGQDTTRAWDIGMGEMPDHVKKCDVLNRRINWNNVDRPDLEGASGRRVVGTIE